MGATDPAAAAKALYCAAGLARGSEEAVQLLLDAGGLGTAVKLLGAGPGGAARPASLRRKALSLLADLAHAPAQARARPARSDACLRDQGSCEAARGWALAARADVDGAWHSLVSLLRGSVAHVCIFWVASGWVLQAMMGKHMEAAGDAASVTAAVRGQLATSATDQDWDTAERALLALRALTAVPAVAKQLHVRLPFQTGTTLCLICYLQQTY